MGHLLCWSVQIRDAHSFDRSTYRPMGSLCPYSRIWLSQPAFVLCWVDLNGYACSSKEHLRLRKHASANRMICRALAAWAYGGAKESQKEA